MRPSSELIDGLRRPIRTGWQLWFHQVGPLTLWVGLPIGLLCGLFSFATSGMSWGEGAAILAVVVCGAAAAAAVAVILSRAHTGMGGGSPWPQVASRLLPWSIAWLLFGAGVLVGTLLLVIPGIIAGVRLFWADEFALVHRQGPVSALRESVELTRGAMRSVFTFQFVLGLAEYLVLAPVFLGFIAVGTLAESLPPGFPTTVVLYTLLSVLLVNAYASAHAPEVVYFYGLRALRAAMAPDEIRGDWVARGLRAGHGSRASKLEACPSCGSSWDPADYREDAEPIFCSACKAPLRRPG